MGLNEANNRHIGDFHIGLNESNNRHIGDFHIGLNEANNRHIGDFHIGLNEANNRHIGDFHIGLNEANNRHIGDFHMGLNVANNRHIGDFHIGLNVANNRHIGDFHMGLNVANNRHIGDFHIGPNEANDRHIGDFHIGPNEANDRHIGDFHIGPNEANNRHIGDFHIIPNEANDRHIGDFHIGPNEANDRHIGYFHIGPNEANNRHIGYFHIGPNEANDRHIGDFHIGPNEANDRHIGDFHIGPNEANDMHIGDFQIGLNEANNMHIGDFHIGPNEANNRHIGDFHIGPNEANDRHIGDFQIGLNEANDMHIGYFHMGLNEANNRHIGDFQIGLNEANDRHIGDFHIGPNEANDRHIGDFHIGPNEANDRHIGDFHIGLNEANDMHIGKDAMTSSRDFTGTKMSLNDLHRVMQKSQSALAQQLMVLCATLNCLLFISACGIQHIQRGGNRQLGLFESVYFTVVTLSTVGFGDIHPDIWPSQLFMLCMITAALLVLPTQLEQLAYTWMERQKQGGAYSSHRAQTEKHVVVCTTTLQADTVMDFLNEFYSHPKLQDHFVVLLSPCEMDPTMKVLLQVPIWAQRVIFIQGSALKDIDLARCRVQDAEACFILSSQNVENKEAADQHTIMRSWAIKDFGPECPQYVQIFRPENKFHVKFAEVKMASRDSSIYTGSDLIHDYSCSKCGEDDLNAEAQHFCPQCEHCLCDKCVAMHNGYHKNHTVYGRGDIQKWAGFSMDRCDQHGSKLEVHCDDHKELCCSVCVALNHRLCSNISHLPDLARDFLKTKEEGQTSSEEWQRLYGRCSGNEIYHVRLGESKFFGEYLGKSFTYASFHAHRKYGVSLVGVQQNSGLSTIQLNPGPRHIMRESDICFYMNITKEENSAFILAHPNQEDSKPDKKINMQTGAEPVSKIAGVIASVGTMALELQHTRLMTAPTEIKRTGSRRTQLELPKGFNPANLQKRPSIAPVPAYLEGSGITINVEDENMSEDSFPYADEEENPEYVRGFPPITPYIGTSPTLCHLEYNWPNRAIIVAADYASNGLYNFIVPLRSHARPSNTLNPIVLLLEKRPDTAFMETICHFPMVYWMLGSIEQLDDLLRSGINLADNVVIVNKESSNSQEEETLADCNTIVAVQTIFRLFPSGNIITELTQSSNMRFMQFRANDSYSYELSKLEKKEKERGSHISYMFRLPFAGGNVFSASMLDTLLYQAFVKDYLITFVRLLLGIDQAMKITKDDLWIRTYGRLYQKLCSTTCEIPIGIYRTQVKSCRSPPANHSNSSFMSRDQSALNLAFRNSVVSLNMMSMADQEKSDSHSSTMNPERHEISQLVKCRMKSLQQPLEDYDEKNEKANTISYVPDSTEFPLTKTLATDR
ncbi:KCNT1-like protein [Mya arenaria]|uniref:KCNT1-like protein n=1 Tax=Mya arenaria TaxID=6604 RepID=A0ABY7G899_MYAAR|nr:KCNT1-like protein [Mya arenaria]